MKLLGGGRISSMTSKRASELCGVDLTDNDVRLVHAKNVGGKLLMQNVRNMKFAEGNDEEISRYLAATFDELRIMTRQVMCVLPSHCFISKNIDMPSKDREEIRKIIDLQAGRYTPYSRDEIIIDFVCVDSPGQHYTNVLLIIVNRVMVERYCSIFERARLDVGRVVIASEGLAMTYQRMMGETFEDSAIGGVHIDWGRSDFSIVDNGQMLFVRSIPLGARQLSEGVASARGEFIKELNQSIVGYQNQGIGKNVKNLLVTSLTGGLEPLAGMIQTSIPAIQSGQILLKEMDYRQHFDISPDVTETMEAATEVSYFEVMASLEARAQLKIDLIPREVKMRRRVREGGKEALTFGILCMVLLTLIVFFLATKMFIMKTQLEKRDTLNKSISEEARLLERASTKSRVLSNLIEKRGGGLYAFQILLTMIGDDMYLVSFSYDNQGNLKFAGTADSMSKVFAFVTKLEESNSFKDVKAEQTKSRREGKQEVADFEISCTLTTKV